MSSVDLSRVQVEALRCCYWHRLVTTSQLHQLLVPHASLSYLRQELRPLRAAGLLASTPRRRSDRQLAWYVTDVGAAVAQVSGELDARAFRMTPATAVGALCPHTHDVIETGITFVRAARRHGDDCGPLSWTPEVAHRLSDRGEVLIVDAVLHYAEQTRFIEVDRATMPVHRLATKLARYPRYQRYVPRRSGLRRPAWRSRYSRWPGTVVVLAGAPEPVLRRRLSDLRGHLAALLGPGPSATMIATTLRLLQEYGPTEPIGVPLLGADPTPIAVIEP